MAAAEASMVRHRRLAPGGPYVISLLSSEYWVAVLGCQPHLYGADLIKQCCLDRAVPEADGTDGGGNGGGKEGGEEEEKEEEEEACTFFVFFRFPPPLPPKQAPPPHFQ